MLGNRGSSSASVNTRRSASASRSRARSPSPALLLAFAVGRFISPQAAIETLAWLGLRRTHELMVQMAPLDTDRRLRFPLGCGGRSWSRRLLQHRYVAVAIALNMPGNVVLGGGGGIALAAGFSRLFSLPAFALTVALAVSPVPIALLLMPV